MNETYLYTQGVEEARCNHELSLWRASHQANIACKNAIQESIRLGFDGMFLKKDCANEVLEAFGFKRVNWVLANTLQEKHWDGRFSQENKAWSRHIYIPDDCDHKQAFVVNTHPAVLDGFVNQAREAYEALQLFGPQHCTPDTPVAREYEGNVLVLSPDCLKESCWSPENQLWYAHDEFGCSPNAIEHSIRCTCLGTGETTRWNPSAFVGILKEEFLPDWAKEQLEQLAPSESGPTMGGL